MIFVPYFMGARTRDGAGLAPAEVVEPALPEGTPLERLGVLYAELARRVAAASDRRLQVGDCTASIGVVAGLQARGIDPAVVWLDAHGDFNTWETTPSGFLGGMPLAMLAGLGEQSIGQAAGQRRVAPEHILLVGARDLDPGEEVNLERARVRQLAIEELAADVLPEGPIYLHLDTDLVRLEEMPAVNYPAAGGPDAAEVRRAVEAVMATGRVAAFSYTGWDPNLPGAEVSMATARRMLRGLLF